jgi:hypothetical protein
MGADITNLYHLLFVAQHSPNRHIGGSAFLKVAMMAVLPEFSIIGPVGLNRSGELHLG